MKKGSLYLINETGMVRANTHRQNIAKDVVSLQISASARIRWFGLCFVSSYFASLCSIQKTERWMYI